MEVKDVGVGKDLKERMSELEKIPIKAVYLSISENISGKKADVEIELR